MVTSFFEIYLMIMYRAIKESASQTWIIIKKDVETGNTYYYNLCQVLVTAIQIEEKGLTSSDRTVFYQHISAILKYSSFNDI